MLCESVLCLEKREEYFVYLSSKTTLDKSGPVVAHHDFVFNLFCLAGHECFSGV